jgi:hypothetical protein
VSLEVTVRILAINTPLTRIFVLLEVRCGLEPLPTLIACGMEFFVVCHRLVDIGVP